MGWGTRRRRGKPGQVICQLQKRPGRGRGNEAMKMPRNPAQPITLKTRYFCANILIPVYGTCSVFFPEPYPTTLPPAPFSPKLSMTYNDHVLTQDTRCRSTRGTRRTQYDNSHSPIAAWQEVGTKQRDEA